MTRPIFSVSVPQLCAIAVVVLCGLWLAWHLGRWHERSRIARAAIDELVAIVREEQERQIAEWVARRRKAEEESRLLPDRPQPMLPACCEEEDR